jgi:prepilin-type N-terminal cleavage/methylation domain-containing protein
MTRLHDDEGGFTLPELLMAIALLMIITAPLMLSFVTSVRYIGKTDQKFTDTRGGLLSAAYFSSDVASASTISSPDAAPCGGAGTGLTGVVSFNWSDTSVNTTYEVSWVFDSSSASNLRLLRKVCTTVNGSTTTSQSVPAVSLAGPPALNCYDPAVSGSAVPDATCSAATRWVKMVITGALNSPTPDNPSPQQATFTLEGTRRSK